MPNDFRIIFKTKDGSLIMDRKTDSHWFDGYDKTFLIKVMNDDARIRGVRVVSHTREKNTATAIVEYL
jgi:hypothetical protein